MKETKVIHPKFLTKTAEIDDLIHHFESSGTPFGKQTRNSLKLFELDDKTVNIKSFKIPHIINQINYKFFRKSKAQRSFEYAKKLTNLGVDTPQPIAYYEFETAFLFKNSYYISEQLDCDLTFRELTTNLNYPDHENILRAFTRFTFSLHEKEINFLDHSPGNTLIKKAGTEYQFYLVDLNRMEFRTMDFKSRIKNLSRLTTEDDLIKVMSDEYAKLYHKSYDTVYKMLRNTINAFQNKINLKKTLKKKLLLKKK